MSIDIEEIAYQFTSDTPQTAAINMTKLFKTVLGLLPNAHSRGQFIAKCQAELAMLGYQLEPGARLVYFSHLSPGDQFKTANGKLYRKIEPIPQPDFRGESTPSLTALDLQTNKPVYISANERVEKVG